MRSEAVIGEGWEAFLQALDQQAAEFAADLPVDLPSLDAAGNVVWHRYFGLRLTEVTYRSGVPETQKGPAAREGRRGQGKSKSQG